MKGIVLSLAIAMAASSTVLAQVAAPRANVRQKSQRMRMAEGRQDGDLTNQEAAVLNTEQRHVRRAERRAKADGKVTIAEHARIERKQDRASRHIRRAKSDNRTKPQ